MPALLVMVAKGAAGPFTNDIGLFARSRWTWLKRAAQRLARCRDDRARIALVSRQGWNNDGSYCRVSGVLAIQHRHGVSRGS